MRRVTLVEALQPDSPYVFYSDDHGFCINTADVMDILTMDKESGYHWIPCSEGLPKEKDAGILKKLGIEKKVRVCPCYSRGQGRKNGRDSLYV